MTPSLTSTSSPATRPLDLAALVGDAGWSRLPAAVRRRFATGHRDTRYDGTMSLHCSPIGRVFAWLARAAGSPLAGANDDDVATQVRVFGDGAGGVVWQRDFGGRQRVRSTKALDASGRLVERTEGGLGMALDVFESGGSLVFESRRFFLLVGARRWRLPVPWLLTPGTCRVTHTDLGGGRFRFTLAMTHPLWGRTFHQTGVFRDPT
jgi:hypothetical protein